MGWLPFCDHMKDHAAEVVLYGRHGHEKFTRWLASCAAPPPFRSLTLCTPRRTTHPSCFSLRPTVLATPTTQSDNMRIVYAGETSTYIWPINSWHVGTSCAWASVSLMLLMRHPIVQSWHLSWIHGTTHACMVYLYIYGTDFRRWTKFHLHIHKKNRKKAVWSTLYRQYFEKLNYSQARAYSSSKEMPDKGQ